MGSLRPSDAPRARTSRCPACGRRVSGSCLQHGPVDPPASDVDALNFEALPPVIAGHAIVRFIARGGFGAVFEATRVEGGPPVALKVARDDMPGAARRLAAEVRALEHIGPPHVPAVVSRGETLSGTPYFAMDYLGHATLADRLANRPEPMPIT